MSTRIHTLECPARHCELCFKCDCGMNAIRARLATACEKVIREGGKIVATPFGIDGEICPMQAVCIEKVGGWGLMWYPWDEGPMHELGITRPKVWSFIAGFDGKPPTAYKWSGEKFEQEFYQLGVELRAEFIPRDSIELEEEN